MWRWFGYGCVILCFALLGASWYFSSLVLEPRVVCRPEHHVFCTDPTEVGLPFEETSFETQDKVRLGGWFIPAKNSRRGLVLVHGHGGSRREGLRFAPALHKAGFQLFLIDLRLHSPDGGQATMGFHERKDVQSAITYLREERKIPMIGLMGFSMGAATSILAMAEDDRVSAAVFSSGYANMRDQLTEAAWRDFRIPRFPLVDVAMAVANWRGNLDLDQIRPEEAIGRIAPRPVFLMHCDRDHYVDSSHVYRLYEAASEPKELWVPVCDRHELIWNRHPQEAETRVVDFFKKNL